MKHTSAKKEALKSKGLLSKEIQELGLQVPNLRNVIVVSSVRPGSFYSTWPKKKFLNWVARAWLYLATSLIGLSRTSLKFVWRLFLFILTQLSGLNCEKQGRQNEHRKLRLSGNTDGSEESRIAKVQVLFRFALLRFLPSRSGFTSSIRWLLYYCW